MGNYIGKFGKGSQIGGVLLLTLSLVLGGLPSEALQIQAAKRKTPKLSKKKLTLVTGQKKKLKLKNKKGTVKWKSSRKKIASVNKKGTVKALKAGKTVVSATIKVKGKKKVFKCRVTVIKKKVPPKQQETVNPTQPGIIIPPAPTSGVPFSPDGPSGTITPPEYTNHPSETEKPGETKNPSETKKPGETTNPSETEKPGETEVPSNTEIPEETVSPSETTKPGGTEKPEETSEPSEQPVKTAVPTKVPGTPIPVPDSTKVLKLDFEDGKNEYVTGRQGEEKLTVEAGGAGDNYCLKVSNRVKNWAGPQIKVTHNVVDYATYTVEAYVKHTAGGNRDINCMWEATDFSDNHSYTTIKTLKVPTGNWQKIEATVVAPGDVKEVYIYFEMQNYPNDFWVDNISITEKHLDLEQVLAVDSLKEAYQSRFPVGCSVYSYHLKNPEIVSFVKHHYNTVTFGDELKPEVLLDEERTRAAEDGMPVIRTDIIDKCLSLAKENELKVRFHTLVWYSQTPDWYFCENYKAEYDGTGTAKKNITNLVDKETMLKRMECYVTQIISYTETKYPGTVYAYDVVNEVINSSLKLRTGEESLYGAIFPNEDTTYITNAFRYAKAARDAAKSEAKLFYNDYVGLASSGQRKAVVNYLADAKAEGTIDGLGMQSHQTNLSVSDGDNIKNSLNYFRDNGYEVQITEIDFNNKDNSESGNATLANAYTKFMQIIFDRMDKDSVKITNFTFWNLTDLDTWLNSFYGDGNTYYPSLFDENYMPKAAFTALINLAKNNQPSPTPTVTPGSSPTPSPGGPTEKPTVPTEKPVIPGKPETPAKPEKPASTVSLDLSNGDIVISATGYSQDGGAEQAYTGAYTITGSASHSVAVTGGTHVIVLDGVTTTTTAVSPIALSGDAKVTLILENQSTLSAPASHAGIEVIAGCELTIAGNGTLSVASGQSAAAIGASGDDKENTSTLGKIVILSGTILAVGGRNGAGIGDSRGGLGGGEIEIYGGNIFAQSSGNGAGIGGGGNQGKTPTTLTITICGGIITAGGSNVEIGDGKGQTHCVVNVYGGSFRASNSKTLFGTTTPTLDAYGGESISVSGLSGIQSVTVDGVDQGISSLFITDAKGTTNARYPLNLYMTKADSHTVVVTDADGVQHETVITR